MDIAEKTKRAKAISEATGVSFSRAFKVVEDHPDPEPSKGSNRTYTPAPAVTDHRKSKFWTMVEDLHARRGGKIVDAILAVRKQDPAAFNEYLEIANS